MTPESTVLLTRVSKRLVDLTVGSLLAVVALPIIAILAVALSISLRANPFFVQHRVGRHGRPLLMIKLRTLPPETPEYADRYQIQGALTTPIAAAIRRLHLDELPQLFLVPLGAMSLVGPRPEMAHLYERMPERQAGTRIRLRPGCTGLWQVSVGYTSPIAERPRFDIFYEEHRTVRMDLWILWRTLALMAGLAGRVRLHDVPRWTLTRASRRGLADTDGPEVVVDRRQADREDEPRWVPEVREVAKVAEHDQTAALLAFRRIMKRAGARGERYDGRAA